MEGSDEIVLGRVRVRLRVITCAKASRTVCSGVNVSGLGVIAACA